MADLITQNSATTLTLTSDLEILMERIFDAPRELVFRVMTDPTHIPHWWGPRRLTTTVEQMDVRPGGIWRYLQRDEEGNEYAFIGMYREILAPELLVYTFEFEPWAGHGVVETVRFEDVSGKTKISVTSRFKTLEDRDGMLQSGMEIRCDRVLGAPGRTAGAG